MSTITYRDALRGDAALLTTFWRETFLATFGHLYPPEDVEMYFANYGVETTLAELDDLASQCRLAFDGERLVGAAKLGAFKLPITPDVARVLELHRLYLTKDAQGTGVAQALMDWVMERAREGGAGALYLGVYKYNERAQRFYKRYGFVEVGTYEFEVGATRDPEYIMRAPVPRG